METGSCSFRWSQGIAALTETPGGSAAISATEAQGPRQRLRWRSPKERLGKLTGKPEVEPGRAKRAISRLVVYIELDLREARFWTTVDAFPLQDHAPNWLSNWTLQLGTFC